MAWRGRLDCAVGSKFRCGSVSVLFSRLLFHPCIHSTPPPLQHSQLLLVAGESLALAFGGVPLTVEQLLRSPGGQTVEMWLTAPCTAYFTSFPPGSVSPALPPIYQSVR